MSGDSHQSTRRKLDPVREAAAALKAALDSGAGVVAQADAALTFEAVRATGARGQLFVSVHQDETGKVVFLAPPEHGDAETCIILGTANQVTQVAGIIRRRVTGSDR